MQEVARERVDGERCAVAAATSTLPALADDGVEACCDVGGGDARRVVPALRAAAIEYPGPVFAVRLDRHPQTVFRPPEIVVGPVQTPT